MTERTISKEQSGALRRMRAQVLAVHHLEERVRAERREQMRSARLDGMPKGKGGMPQGLDAQISRADALERILERERLLMREYERGARKAMDGMAPETYGFCTMYYLSGMSMEETGRTIDRSRRQCSRIRSRIEGEEELEDD